LPEWFNPAYAPYGYSNWPGGLAHNAYNWSELEPYTGFVEVNDYVLDIQKPQMEILVGDKYNTNIMWCDIGGPTNITAVIPRYMFRSEFHMGTYLNIMIGFPDGTIGSMKKARMLSWMTDVIHGHVRARLRIVYPTDHQNVDASTDDFSTPEYSTYGVVKQDKWERRVGLFRG
jgi:hypothetical protein